MANARANDVQSWKKTGGADTCHRITDLSLFSAIRKTSQDEISVCPLYEIAGVCNLFASMTDRLNEPEGGIQGPMRRGVAAEGSDVWHSWLVDAEIPCEKS